MFDRVYWLVDGRVIVAQYSDTLELQDVAEAVSQVIGLMDSDGQPPLVHVIFDASYRTALSSDVMNVKRVAALTEDLRHHRLLGWFMVADSSPHPIMRFVGSVVSQLVMNRFRICASLDDCIQFLQMTDETLPEMNTKGID